MAIHLVWIIERKYHRRGRKWESSLDHPPFISQNAAEQIASEAQAAHIGWEYRASPFIRKTE